MIRKRDVAAVLFAIALSHLIWNEQESLSATVRLAFYLSQSSFLSPMDLDGDGTPESLVQLLRLSQDTAYQEKNNQQTSWKFKVLSLPISKYNNNHRPQIPETILESTLFSPGNRSSAVSPPLEPLRMTVGHVLIPKRDSILQRSAQQKQQKDTTTSSTQQQDRTRHYFCGTDWHHAAQSCQTHCPTGRSSDCPDGQRCFADTPCDAQAEQRQPSLEESPSSSDSRLMDTRNVTSTYALSPVGGLPSVMLLWSNAILTLHSWTALRTSRQIDSAEEPAQQLQFETMWTLNLFPEQETHFHIVSWIESTLQFVDAVDAGNDSGLVLVSAAIEILPHDQHPRFDTVEAHLTVAVDARTGQVVWRELQMSNDAIEAGHSLHDTPMVLRDVTARGTSSVARRRSLIPDLHSTSTSNSLLPEQHCMQSYFRRPLLTATSSLPGEAALPFVYSSQQDASTRVLHFDLDQPVAHAHKSNKVKKNDNKIRNNKDHQHETNSKLKRHSKPTVLHGRPNVVVLHNQKGLQVRSLKNGRILCRLALNENALYADVNHDGTLDSVQLALGTHAVMHQSLEQEEEDDDFRFITNLAQRVAEGEATKKTNIAVAAPLQRTSLCHLMVLSGMPSREELYSSNLCNGYLSPSNQQELRGVAPLLMEPMDSRKGWDIVAAINSGVVNRIHGASGRQLWRLKGRRNEHLLEGASFPHWNEAAIALLTRIDTIQTVPPTRPILLAGENSLVLLSASTGKLLASATFHQPSIRRPVMMDFDGDGTSDVLIHTKDAVWGYKIRVHTGSPVFLRIGSGILFMSILLAFLRNRFGPQPGKRSTDALSASRR
ncbi:hypothetical protein FisN_21Hh017 [Fistulifera solaris]|uniref:Uncharacterized protein n=1 Tax=Fistulifera solaris TaxID=1519565 RepID=A0A1Z5KAL1_FISSO|nr:hypothetical protein FisN_21Hh017 [Fistulifera solaris]|eukprot:GAX23297.1 hypothetical protein FisN_21Hh017 [Fistulifera solaris]